MHHSRLNTCDFPGTEVSDERIARKAQELGLIASIIITIGVSVVSLLLAFH